MSQEASRDSPILEQASYTSAHEITPTTSEVRGGATQGSRYANEPITSLILYWQLCWDTPLCQSILTLACYLSLGVYFVYYFACLSVWIASYLCFYFLHLDIVGLSGI